MIRAQVNPEYFLDKMTWKEATLLLNELEVSNRDSWEQTRLLMWATLQSQSSKKIKPVDVLPFSWDVKPGKEVTREDIYEFKKRKGLL